MRKIIFLKCTHEGTEKTYLTNLLLTKHRSENVACTVASSGIVTLNCRKENKRRIDNHFFFFFTEVPLIMKCNVCPPYLKTFNYILIYHVRQHFLCMLNNRFISEFLSFFYLIMIAILLLDIQMYFIQ